MHLTRSLVGFFFVLSLSSVQAKPYFLYAFEDDDFENDLSDYFIDVDASRTPMVEVKPFVLPTNDQSADNISADIDDSTYDFFETPAVYAEKFEQAFDDVAEQLESILRMVLMKFKESIINSFDIVTNSRPTVNSDKETGSDLSKGEDSNIVNENKMEVNETVESENKTVMDQNKTTADLKNSKTPVEIKVNSANNELKSDSEAKPEIKVKRHEVNVDSKVKTVSDIKVNDSKMTSDKANQAVDEVNEDVME